MVGNEVVPKTDTPQKERWASTLGGAALLVAGARRLADDRPGQAALLSAVGAALIWRGGAGHFRAHEIPAIGPRERGETQQARVSGRRDKHAEVAVSIDCRPDELYRVWRRFDKFPHLLPNVTAVEPIDYRTSRWIARGLGGLRVKWIMELVNDVPNQLLAWQTVGGTGLVNTWSIRFVPEAGNRGTIVSAQLDYRVPGGKVGAALAAMFGKDPSQAVREGLRRLKQVMEAGEIPTTNGQPRGGR
jgi:uncharacterized membrane protein